MVDHVRRHESTMHPAQTFTHRTMPANGRRESGAMSLTSARPFVSNQFVQNGLLNAYARTGEPTGKDSDRDQEGKQLGLILGIIGGAALVGGIIAAAALSGGGSSSTGARKTVNVNVTRLSGVADTTAADIARANQVYTPANLEVKTATTTTLSAADSQAILGADNKLDDFTGNTLTAEEQKLVVHNRTAGRITAYYVPQFSHGGVRGEAITPTDFGVTDPSIVVGANTRVADTFAHEIGHVLTNDGGHSGDPANLMASGSIRDFTDNLTPAQISTIRSSPYAT